MLLLQHDDLDSVFGVEKDRKPVRPRISKVVRPNLATASLGPAPAWLTEQLENAPLLLAAGEADELLEVPDLDCFARRSASNGIEERFIQPRCFARSPVPFLAEISK